MPEFLRPVLARIIASLVGGLAAWLTGKGIALDQSSIDAFVTVMLTIFTIVYSLVHKAINAKINPTDAARISTATAGKEKLG